MSVHRSGGSDRTVPDRTGFEELEHEAFSVTSRLNNPQTEFGDGAKFEFDRVHEFGPELERGEWAELVYIWPLNHEMNMDSGFASEFVQYRNYYEISFEEEMKLGDWARDDRSVDLSDQPIARDSGVSPSSDNAWVSNIRPTDDWGVIYHSKTHTTPPIYDTANTTGTGGQHGRDSAHEFMNYRQAFGGGPVIRDDQELYLHTGWNFANATDDNISSHIEIQLGWDVFEP